MLKLGPLDFKEISSISGPLTKALKECVFGSEKARKYFNYLFKYYSENQSIGFIEGTALSIRRILILQKILSKS